MGAKNCYHLLTKLIAAGCLVAFVPPSQAQSLASLIQTLNHAPKSSTYPFAADDDIVRRNANELRDIGDRCPAPRTDRNARNAFFHREVQTLNAAAHEWLAPKPEIKTTYRRQAEIVLASVTQHPVAGIAATAPRERSGEIGYCFGRALLAHYLLLKAGVPSSDLIKVFALGELMMQGQFWRFHVAVGVRDATHGFLMVDPLHPMVLPVAEWLKRTAGYDIKQPLSRVRFYPTDPRKFLPAFGVYDLKQLKEPHLRAYFADLAATL